MRDHTWDWEAVNDQASSMHPCGQHLTSNLVYVIFKSYITMLLNLCQAKCPLQNTYFLTTYLCYVFVLVNVLVIKPLLRIHK